MIPAADSSRSIPEDPSSLYALIDRYGIASAMLIVATYVAWKVAPSWIAKNEAQAKLATETVVALADFRKESQRQTDTMGRIERDLSDAVAAFENDRRPHHGKNVPE